MRVIRLRAAGRLMGTDTARVEHGKGGVQRTKEHRNVSACQGGGEQAGSRPAPRKDYAHSRTMGNPRLDQISDS